MRKLSGYSRNIRCRLMTDDPQYVDSETFKRLLDVEIERWASLLDLLAAND